MKMSPNNRMHDSLCIHLSS